MSYIDFYFVLPVVQIVCDFDWEMDVYEVCMEFVLFCFDASTVSTCERAPVLNLCVAMQDFADEKVKDEVLPEDEKEKFKVYINICS